MARKIAEIKFKKPPLNDSDVIRAIMNMASSGLRFAPRAVAHLNGISHQLATTHCELIAKTGKLKPYVQDQEVWYRGTATVQLQLL